MVNDAEKYGEQDKERKAAIEMSNRADSVLNDTEKALTEFSDKLDKTEVDQIKEKIEKLREFVVKNQAGEGNATASEIKTKTDELQTASLTLFDKMHKARAEEQSSGAGEQQTPPSGGAGEQQPPNEGTQGTEGEKKP